jgi:RimJ/RimL family protein N-acetyltransferase
MTQEQNHILIDIPMPIETDRLLLRVPQAGDGDTLFNAMEETFDQLQKWMPWANELGTAQDAEATCRRAHGRFILREDMMVLAFDKATNQFIGSSGLHRFDWTLRRFEIGYWVRANAQGKGYATEIANALTRFAFDALDARSVMIGHAAGNERSKNVIQKLGFEQEAHAKLAHELPSGDIVDEFTYSRINTDDLPDLKVWWS